jgi:hypothetical protein
MHALRTVEFLNETWNPYLELRSPLKIRVSCHRGEVVLDPANPESAHGSDLDWFIKGERAIGLPDAVTITNPLKTEISPSLANLFDLREQPYSHELDDVTISWALYTHSKNRFDDKIARIVGRILGWNKRLG